MSDINRTELLPVSDLLKANTLFETDVPVPLPELPKAIQEWLEGFFCLKEIPMEWIVPDAANLPVDSIRLFFVNPTWAEAMVDGVLAAGRVGVMDEAAMASLRQGLRTRALGLVGGSAPVRAGLLLRSAAVRHAPTLLVTGWVKKESDYKSVKILSRRLPSRDVLLVVFEGVPDKIVIQEPPVATRFQVEFDDKIPSVPKVNAAWAINRKDDISGYVDADGYLDVNRLISNVLTNDDPYKSPAGFSLLLQDQPFVLTIGDK